MSEHPQPPAGDEQQGPESNRLVAGFLHRWDSLMDRLIKFDHHWFVASKIAVTGSAVVMLAIAVNRRFMGRVPVIRVLQFFCAGYAALIVWELYLRSLMFPRLAGSMAGAWTSIFP